MYPEEREYSKIKYKIMKTGIWGVKRKLMRRISVIIHLVVKSKNGNVRNIIRFGE